MEKCNCFLFAVAGTNTATHAQFLVDQRIAVINLDGRELAVFAAVTASDTEVLVNRADKAGSGQHGRTMLVSFHRTTAACAAVADGIETSQHGIFEECVVDVTAIFFSLQYLDRLI